jgi:hypothetical protein
MSPRIVDRFVADSPRVVDGMGAFLAGIVLVAVPLIAMVGSTTLPTQAGHWIALLSGLALILYGVFRGIEGVSRPSAAATGAPWRRAAAKRSLPDALRADRAGAGTERGGLNSPAGG